MEEQSIEQAGGLVDSNTPPVAWRDLREWLALIERNGLLKRIDKSVDADEELAVIAYLATHRENAPALLFETIAGDRFGTRILANMLGSSKERYALAVGLDPALSIAGMISATRDIMQRRIKPVSVAKEAAPVNEVVLRGDQVDLTQFPAPKFWPGDGGRYIGTATSRSHAILTVAASMSAAIGRCCTGRAAWASIARPASMG
jgi:UbiD family decarboxylase